MVYVYSLFKFTINLGFENIILVNLKLIYISLFIFIGIGVA